MYIMSIFIVVLIGAPVIGMMLFPFFLFFSIPAVAAGGSMILLKNVGKGANGGILVVDDDFGSVLPLISILEDLHRKVNFVPSGKAMIQALAKNKYEMIFLDSKMPDLLGEEALVEGDQLLDIADKQPVVFFSGTVAEVTVPDDLKNFVVKDFWKKGDLEDLRESVSRLLVTA